MAAVPWQNQLSNDPIRNKARPQLGLRRTVSEAKRLGRNFSSIAVAQLFSQVLTLILSVSLARVLGIADYGIFVFAFVFPSWILLLVSFGLDAVVAVDVAADRSKAGRYVASVALLRLPLAFIAFGTLWAAVHLLLSDPFARTVTLIVGGANILETYAGSFTAVFRAFERMEFDALVTIVERIVTVGIVLFLLSAGYGLLQVAYVIVAGSALSLVLSLTILRVRFTWFAGRPSARDLWGILKKASPFAASGVVGTLTVGSGPILLTLLRNPTATGEFNAGFALVFAILAFLSIYHNVLLPAMSRIFTQDRAKLAEVVSRTQKMFFALGLPTALGGAFYADRIITLFYGDAFLGAATSLQILVFSVALSTATIGVGTALVATNHQKLSLAIRTLGMVLNFALCVALIPGWGPVGAAYGFVTAGLFMGLLGTVAMHRIVAPVDLRSILVKPIVAGAAMVTVLAVLPSLHLWLGIPVGIVVYFGALTGLRGLTREDWGLIRDALHGAVFR